MRNRSGWVHLAVVVAIISGIACQAPAPPPQETAPAPPDHAAELAPVAEGFMEAISTGELDRFDELMTADVKRIAPDQNVEGLEAMKEFFTQVRGSYAGFDVAVHDSAYDENLAFMHWTVTGTSVGEGGAEVAVEVQGMTILRFVDGKISEEIVQYDTATLVNQLEGSTLPHTTTQGDS